MRKNPFEADVDFLERMFEADVASLLAISAGAPPINKPHHLTVEQQNALRIELGEDPAFRQTMVETYGEQLVAEFQRG